MPNQNEIDLNKYLFDLLFGFLPNNAIGAFAKSCKNHNARVLNSPNVFLRKTKFTTQKLHSYYQHQSAGFKLLFAKTLPLLDPPMMPHFPNVIDAKEWQMNIATFQADIKNYIYYYGSCFIEEAAKNCLKNAMLKVFTDDDTFYERINKIRKKLTSFIKMNAKLPPDFQLPFDHDVLTSLQKIPRPSAVRKLKLLSFYFILDDAIKTITNLAPCNHFISAFSLLVISLETQYQINDYRNKIKYTTQALTFFRPKLLPQKSQSDEKSQCHIL